MRVILTSVVGACAIALLVVSACLPGCEYRHEYRGKQMTADEIVADRDAELAKRKADDDRESADAKRVAEAARAEADLAVQRLNADAQIKAAEISADLARKMGEIAGKYQAASDARSVEMAKISAGADAALKSIEKQREAVAALWSFAKPFVSTAAAGVPGGQQGLGLIETLLGISTVGGVGAAVVKSKQASAAQAAADDHESALRSVANAIDVLRMKVPAVAEAMKANKADLLTQLTDTAVKIINEERIS